MSADTRPSFHIPTCSEILARVVPIFSSGRGRDVRVEPKATTLSPVIPQPAGENARPMSDEEVGQARIEAAKNLFPEKH